MSQYEHIIIEKYKFNHSTWRFSLSQTLPERTPYAIDDKQLKIGTITGRILGIPSDEFSFFSDLNEILRLPHSYLLNEVLNNEKKSSSLPIKKAIEKGQRISGLSSKRLVNSLEKEGIRFQHSQPAMDGLLNQSLIRVLEKLKKNYPQTYAHPDFNTIVSDLLTWVNDILIPWTEKADIEVNMPKIIWYGDITKSQLYFLYYAMLIGCDVLLFNPDGKDSFADIDPDEEVSFTYWLPEALKKQPLQKAIVSRSETVAYRSSRQFNDELQREGTPIYKPWQFNDYIPKPVTLKTTYDELFLIAKEKAFVRPEFKIGAEEIVIPNLLAQVLGMSRNKKEYWSRIHRLMEIEQTRVIRQFPFSGEEAVDYSVYYREVLNYDGRIDPELLRKSTVWLYGHLPTDKQKAIANAISRLCKSPKLLSAQGENPEETSLYLFTQVTNLSEEGLRWIQLFDYSQTVPKIILYYSEHSGILSRSDAAKLLLLNELGFDIIVYNPPGYACLEQYIDREAFDSHMLDELAFEQRFKSPSLFWKSFGG